MHGGIVVGIVRPKDSDYTLLAVQQGETVWDSVALRVQERAWGTWERITIRLGHVIRWQGDRCWWASEGVNRGVRIILVEGAH